jgi:hypothetical protein
MVTRSLTDGMTEVGVDVFLLSPRGGMGPVKPAVNHEDDTVASSYRIRDLLSCYWKLSLGTSRIAIYSTNGS